MEFSWLPCRNCDLAEVQRIRQFPVCCLPGQPSAHCLKSRQGIVLVRASFSARPRAVWPI